MSHEMSRHPGKECDKLKDINMTMVEVLERETKKARKEEWSKNKF